MITGTTFVAAVIGHPVGHSLSPALHNAAFAASGAPWVYVAFDVAAGEAVRAVDAVRALGIGGLSVTTPHKEAVAAAVDELDPAAKALRSVNTVVRQADGRLVGHSTDGAGFVAAIREAGIEPSASRVAVLGAGAAARSVIDALARSGAIEVVVINRSRERAFEAVQLANGCARVGSLEDLGSADLVVNATSVGMGSDETPVSASLLHAGQIVADLVYHPLDTALLKSARQVGCRTLDGLSMLVHQAALQQWLWVGEAPDVAVMRAAAVRELASRAQVA